MVWFFWRAASFLRFFTATSSRGMPRTREILARYQRTSPSSSMISCLSSLVSLPFLSRMIFLILSATSPASPERPRAFSTKPGVVRLATGIVSLNVSVFSACF